jgi:hypothetical protein
MGAVKTIRQVQCHDLNSDKVYYNNRGAYEREGRLVDRFYIAKYPQKRRNCNNRRKLHGKPMIRRMS